MDMCIDMCTDMCADINMCVDMCTDMYMNMCVDMCTYIYAHMCAYLCHRCAQICVYNNAYRVLTAWTPRIGLPFDNGLMVDVKVIIMCALGAD